MQRRARFMEDAATERLLSGVRRRLGLWAVCASGISLISRAARSMRGGEQNDLAAGVATEQVDERRAGERAR